MGNNEGRNRKRRYFRATESFESQQQKMKTNLKIIKQATRDNSASNEAVKIIKEEKKRGNMCGTAQNPSSACAAPLSRPSPRSDLAVRR